MAAAVTRRYPNEDVWGRHRINIVRVALSGNYATGGEAFEPRDFGIGDPIFVVVVAVDAVTTSLVYHYDRVGKKIMAFEGSAAGTALTEKTNAEAYPAGAEVDVLIIGY